MKKLTAVVFLLLAMLCVSSGQLFAYPISAEQEVYLLQSETGADNGDFGVFDSNDELLFHTFCIEKNVHFYPGSNHIYTATVDDGIKVAKEGGVVKGLHNGAKYLYWHFSQGTLAGFSSQREDITALQEAFWMLQGDLAQDQSNQFFSLALNNEELGESLNVKVMNLWTADGGAAQSQLVVAPVPEPATMLLLGSGLIGLALYRKKMKN